MIRLKNERQIAAIRESCQALAAMFREMIPQVKPGVSTGEIDAWVRDWIKKAGGKPAFLGYGPRKTPFPGAICISINEEVIHGIPGKRKIRNGDLVSLDCGIDLGGFISDKSVTVEAGTVSPAAHDLNVCTRECLYRGIAAARAGDRLLQIARAIQGLAHERGYGVVHQYCGHGVGFDVHEDPQVFNTPKGPNPKLRAGMVIAIEPMITFDLSGDTETLDDDWTVVSADRRLSCHWEHTVALYPDHTEILTED